MDIDFGAETDSGSDYIDVEFRTDLSLNSYSGRDQWYNKWTSTIEPELNQWNKKLEKEQGIRVDIEESGYDIEDWCDVTIFMKFIEA